MLGSAGKKMNGLKLKHQLFLIVILQQPVPASLKRTEKGQSLNFLKNPLVRVLTQNFAGAVAPAFFMAAGAA
jgi:hypothetical protein